MSGKRSIFEEVGAKPATAEAPKGGMIAAGAGRGGAGTALALWLWLLAGLCALPFVAAPLAPALAAGLAAGLVQGAALAALAVFALGLAVLAVLRALPRGALPWLAPLGLALTLAAAPGQAAPVLAALPAPLAAFAPALQGIAQLGALSLAFWQAQSAARPLAERIAARRLGSPRLMGLGLGGAALAAASLLAPQLLAPLLAPPAPLWLGLPLALFAAAAALFARKSPMQATRGAFWLALALSVLQGLLPYLAPAAFLAPLVRLAALAAFLRAAHVARMPLKQSLRG